MKLDPDKAVKVIEYLTKMVRRAAFVHIAYDRDQREATVIDVSENGRRVVGQQSDLGEAILIAAGHKITYRCNVCGETKPKHLFPPPAKTSHATQGRRCKKCRSKAEMARPGHKKVVRSGAT